MVEPTFSRRAVLGTGVSVGLSMTVGALGVANAETTKKSPSRATPTLYGPAAVTAAVRGTAIHGDTLYLVSRFVTDEKLLRVGAFDVNTGVNLNLYNLNVGQATGSFSAYADDSYVYLGLQASAWLWRLDPTTAQVEAFAKVGPPTTWTYDIVADGEDLLVGTFPAGALLRVSRSTGAVTDYGKVGTSQYCTAIAADSAAVYAATSAAGVLKAYPRDGSAPRDLTSLLSPSPVGVLAMVQAGGRLYLSCGRDVISMLPDGSQRVARPIPAEDRYIDKLFAASDGQVYALARLTTNVYRVSETGLVKLGKPFKDVENTAFAQRADGSFVGATGLGQRWRMQPTGEAQVWDSAEVLGYGEKPQSMLAHSSGAVWVAGHGVVSVHDQLRILPPRPGGTAPKHRTRRIDLAGEAKSMAQGPDGAVYLGMYPSTDVVRIDPESFQLTRLASINHDQMRPLNLAFDRPRNQLVIGTTAKHQIHTGAVSYVSATSGDIEVHREVLPDQQVRGLAIADGVAYAAGDTYAEASTTRIRTTAQIAAIDLATRTVLWRIEPLAVESYENLIVVGRTLYALCRRPLLWFSFDLDAGEVTEQGNLGGYGGLGSMNGRVFSWVHGALAIDELPTKARPAEGPRRRYDNVPAGWYNNPNFAIVPRHHGTWGMSGLELAWFPLGR